MEIKLTDMENKIMYWKDGFYETPIEGSVEITSKYWKELLDGQSSGKNILTDENGMPYLGDPVFTIEEIRDMKIDEIRAYDSSPSVNCFYFGDTPMWLDKATRTSLAYTIGVEEAAGATETQLWYPGPPPMAFRIPIPMARQMLAALEIYAKETYNVTQGHIAAVYAREIAEEIQAYDHTLGYPEKLSF